MSKREYASEHLVAHARLDRLAVALDKGARKRDIAFLNNNLGEFSEAVFEHFRMEEERIIPAYAETDEEDAALVLSQHANVRLLVKELEQCAEAEKPDRVRELVGYYRIHQVHEETGLYRWIQSVKAAVEAPTGATEEGSGRERRRHERRTVAVVIHFDSERSGKATGVLRELSVSGARFLTNANFKTGDRVELSLRLPELAHAAECSMDLGAQVIRNEALSRQRAGVWTHIVAVKFDQDLGGHEDQLLALARELEDSGHAD